MPCAAWTYICLPTGSTRVVGLKGNWLFCCQHYKNQEILKIGKEEKTCYRVKQKWMRSFLYTNYQRCTRNATHYLGNCKAQMSKAMKDKRPSAIWTPVPARIENLLAETIFRYYGFRVIRGVLCLRILGCWSWMTHWHISSYRRCCNTERLRMQGRQTSMWMGFHT